MRTANNTLLVLVGLAAASAACRQSPTGNIAFDNGVENSTEIEALPPDESVATPTAELANGDDEASNVDEPTNSH